MSRLLFSRGCLSLSQLRSSMRHVASNAQRAQHAAFTAALSATFSSSLSTRSCASIHAAAGVALLAAAPSASAVQTAVRSDR